MQLCKTLFAIALFASGQSSTFTGTIAGQVILEGFLNLKIPCWQRRLITRGLAIVPALIGVLTLGEHSVGKLLVLTEQGVVRVDPATGTEADAPDAPKW